MLNFKTQKYIFQIQKLVKMVNHMVRVTAKTTAKMKMAVTKTEIKVHISTTATNPMPRMVSTMTRQEMAVVPEMPMVTEAEDQTVHRGEIMEHQEARIILRIVVQIEIQNMEIRKMVMVLQPDQLHEKVPMEITPMELIQVR